MNWDFLYDEVLNIDDAYMKALGVLIGDVKECEVLDAFAMLFGMPL